MACAARVSFKMVFAGLGSVKADGFTVDGGESAMAVAEVVPD
jgi:hypothetical protein